MENTQRIGTCPEHVGTRLPKYHRSIVENAMASGRYGTASEFLRECIEVNGERRGFAQEDDSSLSPRARGTDISQGPANDQICSQGEKPCQQA